MKKFSIYKCSKCDKTATRLVDNVTIPIASCNLTLGCLGTLQLTGYTGDPTKVSRSNVNWQSRFVTPIQTSEIPSAVINLSSGPDGQLALLLPHSNDTFATLTFLVKGAEAQNTRFVFQKSTKTLSVSGPETGPANGGHILRFRVGDAVSVKIDGVLISQTDPVNGYLVSFPTNSITFNTAIAENAIIEVFTGTALATANITQMFEKVGVNAQRGYVGCWANVETVTFDGALYDVYLGDLSLNPLYKVGQELYVVGITRDSGNVALTTMFAVVGVENSHEHVDRVLTHILPLNAIVSMTASVVSRAGDVGLSVNSNMLTSVFPLIRIVSRAVADVLPAASTINTEFHVLTSDKYLMVSE